MAFCPSCGRPVTADASFCTSCGGSIVASQVTSSPPMPSAPVSSPFAPLSRPAARPAGVTIIAVGLLVIASLWIFGAAAVLFLLAMGAAWATSFAQAWMPWLAALGGLFAAFVMVAMLVVLLLAGLAVVTAAGLLRGKEWAWALAIGYMGLNAFSGLFALTSRSAGGLISLAVSGLVIWYFFTPEVRRWFGRA